MKQRVFISNAIDEEKIPFISSKEMKFGRAHYSWKIVADLYHQGLEAAGLEIQRVVRPEIYQTEIAQRVMKLRHDDIHLAVKPVEHIRSFYGIKNIFVAGWEFPEFSDRSYGGNPLYNYISILNHADQIWCWSDFTTNNLKSYGINTAITMPPPVIIPSRFEEKHSILESASLALNTMRIPVPEDIRPLGDVLYEYKGSVIFFSILNPGDERKQIKLMLTAFQMALNKKPNMILIIKLVIDNIFTTVGNIQEILRVRYRFEGQSDRIFFIGDTLTYGQMADLMQTANFYLCTSSTEGLNLPMIEAMSQGLVPISSRATAMADYIHEENAIIIENEKSLTEGMYHFLYDHLLTTHFPPRLSSIVDALVFATELSDSDYMSLSNQAKKTIYKKYSIQSFIDRLKEIGAS